MIPKHELRIGSWVQNIHGWYSQIENGESIDSNHGYIPILLTPEILTKIGGIEDDGIVVWRHATGVWLTMIGVNKYFIQGFRGMPAVETAIESGKSLLIHHGYDYSKTLILKLWNNN